MSRRGFGVAGLAAALLASGAPPAAAQGVPCVNAMQPGCRFTVSGKAGPFIQHVDPKTLEARGRLADAAPGDERGLAEHSINRGEFNRTALDAPQTVAALNRLLAQVRAKWTGPDVGAVRVYLAGSTAFAARAQPDRSIVVSLGLLQHAETDEEVAWVLGHEFSHLALRHYADSAEIKRKKRNLEKALAVAQMSFDMADRAMRMQAAPATVGALASGGVVPLAMVGTHMAMNKRLSVEGAKQEGLDMVGLGESSQGMGSAIAWARGQEMRQGLLLSDALATREQEDEADAAGFDLAAASGFDADGGSIAALKFATEDEKRMALRLSALSQQLQTTAKQVTLSKSTLTTAGMGDAAGAAFSAGKRMTLMGMSWAQNLVVNYLSQNHRPLVVRIQGLSAYAQAAYPPAGPTPQPSKTAWLKAVRSTPEFKAASKAVIARDTAVAQLQAEQAKQALATLQPELSARYGSSPLILNVAAQANVALKQPAKADALYDRAERGSQTLEGWNEHIELLVDQGNVAKAQAKIAEAERRFGDHDRFLPAMVSIAMRQKDSAKTAATVRQCLALEDEVLRVECRTALYDKRQKDALAGMAPDERARLEDEMDRKAGAMTGADMLRKLNPARNGGG